MQDPSGRTCARPAAYSLYFMSQTTSAHQRHLTNSFEKHSFNGYQTAIGAAVCKVSDTAAAGTTAVHRLARQTLLLAAWGPTCVFLANCNSACRLSCAVWRSVGSGCGSGSSSGTYSSSSAGNPPSKGSTSSSRNWSSGCSCTIPLHSSARAPAQRASCDSSTVVPHLSCRLKQVILLILKDVCHHFHSRALQKQAKSAQTLRKLRLCVQTALASPQTELRALRGEAHST